MDVIALYLFQTATPALLGILLWLLTKPLRRRQMARKGLSGTRERETALLLLFVYLAGMIALTLTPPGFWRSLWAGEPIVFPEPFQGGVNLTPIRHSWELLCYYVRHGLWFAVLINFPGNIVMFMPVGFFAGLLSDKPRWWKGLALTAAFSAAIELCQLFVARGTDIDDLILNALGGLMGHWLFLLLRKAAPGLVRRCGKKQTGRI